MFGYLIDPEWEQITTVDYNGDYKEIKTVVRRHRGGDHRQHRHAFRRHLSLSELREEAESVPRIRELHH